MESLLALGLAQAGSVRPGADCAIHHPRRIHHDRLIRLYRAAEFG
jgi:hypothetical protein